MFYKYFSEISSDLITNFCRKKIVNWIINACSFGFLRAISLSSYRLSRERYEFGLPKVLNDVASRFGLNS